MNSTTRFFIILSLFSIAIYVILFNVQDVLPVKAVFKNYYIIQLVIFAVTLGLHSGLTSAGKKSNQSFIRFFMAATGARLFIYMSIMIVYALLNNQSAFGFILHFLVLYLLYTIFEVVYSYRQFSRVASGDKNQ